jgi:hypothetical protein
MKKSLVIGGTIVVLCGVGLVKLKNALIEVIVLDWLEKKEIEERPEGTVSKIIFETRDEALEVLNGLLGLMTDYKVVTIADLKDLAGFTPTFKDNQYGWKDLSKTYVGMVQKGYILTLPKTIILE